ncbi:SHOCT domain-containing protein [Micromonospora halophytica]|uniref:Putative membrane protein n=1 Tax=Micromonospora halophytica TaxID=47864 RepID=A0A1C5HJV6_9ACTN|nr:SHOCT domain-containing protein [Micromonospora halophytica]SCG46147.1 putative membrane protein [Micromonospora halophytica]
MHGTGMAGWMWVWPLLVVAALVVLAVLVVRAVGGGGPQSGVRSARQVLDERYARGEIDEEEYRRRRDALQ